MKMTSLKIAIALLLSCLPQIGAAETSRLVEVPEWKAVFARIETRDRVPARSRLGGVIENIQDAQYGGKRHFSKLKTPPNACRPSRFGKSGRMQCCVGKNGARGQNNQKLWFNSSAAGISRSRRSI